MMDEILIHQQLTSDNHISEVGTMDEIGVPSSWQVPSSPIRRQWIDDRPFIYILHHQYPQYHTLWCKLKGSLKVCIFQLHLVKFDLVNLIIDSKQYLSINISERCSNFMCTCQSNTLMMVISESKSLLGCYSNQICLSILKSKTHFSLISKITRKKVISPRHG